MKTKTLKSLQLIEMVLGVAITALGLSLMMKSGLGRCGIYAESGVSDPDEKRYADHYL